MRQPMSCVLLQISCHNLERIKDSRVLGPVDGTGAEVAVFGLHRHPRPPAPVEQRWSDLPCGGPSRSSPHPGLVPCLPRAAPIRHCAWCGVSARRFAEAGGADRRHHGRGVCRRAGGRPSPTRSAVRVARPRVHLAERRPPVGKTTMGRPWRPARAGGHPPRRRPADGGRGRPARAGRRRPQRPHQRRRR